ncbi:hypothetical protein LZ31DRAFT_558869 [Colletotrichum somersetense]|nr:hypothetical protein LZ31DRAFT_558869 [Colletotrichum somersetense]
MTQIPRYTAPLAYAISQSLNTGKNPRGCGATAYFHRLLKLFIITHSGFQYTITKSSDVNKHALR